MSVIACCAVIERNAIEWSEIHLDVRNMGIWAIVTVQLVAWTVELVDDGITMQA